MKGALARVAAIALKELIQIRRDRVTFAMMLGIPIMQLMLFGFAINTNPKDLPTAVYSEDHSPLSRALVAGFANSGYYRILGEEISYARSQQLLARGDVSFVLVIPQHFTRDLLRGHRPQLLLEADASDPAAAANAIARAQGVVDSVLARELKGALAHLKAPPPPVTLVVHAKYNPEGITQYNIVPGLLGVILTMTSVMFAGMAMTREAERGNLENILAMPVTPLEMMLGKVLPYVGVGAVQTGVILIAAHLIFAVPFAGSVPLLLASVMLFIVANLGLGFTFSTMAKSQMQAMQMTFFFFLPSILLSGFMFPFRGMPDWAQWLGELLPLTHFLRIVRGIMLKGVSGAQLQREFAALLIFIVVMGVISVLRYRRTLD